MSTKKKTRHGFLFALWLLLLLILVIVFLIKKDDFVANLKATNFFERVTGSTPEFIQNYEVKEKEQKSNGLLDVEVTPTPGAAETQAPGTYDLDDLKNNSSNDPETVLQQPEQIVQAEEQQEKEETDTPKKPVQTMNVKLYFVQVDSDGIPNRRTVTRAIPKNDSPLTSTIRALLAGPEKQDKNCMSLIPEGTKLLGASVRNGIAALNFSEEFEFNPIGADGYRAQLMQIVFTATEFATVDSVQFLVEGQRKDYLGSGEDAAMWVGAPYRRNDF